MDWSGYYPGIEHPRVEFADIGCGFGGLTIALATLFPSKCTLAMEIRPKVTEFVRLRIEALRSQQPGSYQNVSVLKTNAMRYLPNMFVKAQLEKMFFCFPDPQFKAKKHRRRIINTHLLTEYAYILKPGGFLYAITDVEALHEWHVEKCQAHPCFEQIPESELVSDVCVQAMMHETEEGKKVARGGGKKYYCVFRRRADADIPLPSFFTS